MLHKYDDTWLLNMRKNIMISFVSDDDLFERLVLKGGNALELVYRVTKRPSLDIDFSMADEFTAKEIPEVKRKILKALSNTFNKENLEVFDLRFEEKPAPDKRINPRGGGYRISFKLIERNDVTEDLDIDKKRRRALHIAGTGTTFKVDISKYEYCENKVKKDIGGFTVYVYSPEMIVLEKMRAICQQTEEYRKQENSSRKPRPRDFYDIYMICEKMKLKLEKPDVAEMLTHIFDRKNVSAELLISIEKYREYHRNGFRELLDTLPLRERDITYDEIFGYTLNKMRVIYQNLRGK